LGCKTLAKAWGDIVIGDLKVADATELAGLVARGEVSASELLDAALAAVEARNPAINAVVLMQEGVAREIHRRRPAARVRSGGCRS
jgi:Asp-tRNA(Asn)/Glu-tRNA(Gln) amidotransferase A subunit family amidase